MQHEIDDREPAVNGGPARKKGHEWPCGAGRESAAGAGIAFTIYRTGTIPFRSSRRMRTRPEYSPTTMTSPVGEIATVFSQ